MKIISNHQIRDLHLSSDEKVEWVESCLRRKSDYDLPPKISLKKPNEIFYNIMPAIMERERIAGVKCVNRYPGRDPSLESTILLYDYADGSLKAILDGDEITSIRTGAIAVHSAELFVRQGFGIVAMVGLGDIMLHTAEIFFDRMRTRSLTVKLYRYKQSAEKWIERFSAYPNLTFEICDTYRQTFEDADLIFSAVTYTEGDFCPPEIYKRGCTVIPIHTRGFMECDITFDKIYGDDTAHLHDFRYFNRFRRFAEVSQVLAGTQVGRENDGERILVYNIGLAIHDLYFAKRILARIDER